MGFGMISRHFPALACTSTSRSRPLLTSSSNCLPVLNCIMVGGLPPTMRLMPAVRALAPPAMALSTQVPPPLVNWSANTFTEADSPADVHQWMTSAFICCASAPELQIKAIERVYAETRVFMLMASSQKRLSTFVIDYILRYRL